MRTIQNLSRNCKDIEHALKDCSKFEDRFKDTMSYSSSLEYDTEIVVKEKGCELNIHVYDTGR